MMKCENCEFFFQVPKKKLTSQQIAGFFCRLSAKKRLVGTDSREVSADENETSAESETRLYALYANVMRDVALHEHPIVSSDRNICELVKRKKLKTLKVKCNEILIRLVLSRNLREYYEQSYSEV